MIRIKQRIERITGVFSDFVGSSSYFIPRGQLAPVLVAALAPIIGACFLPSMLIALPIVVLAQAIETLYYRMSRTI
jgi:hypothetical protein